MPSGVYERTKPSHRKGKTLSEEQKSKMVFFKKGHTPWNSGLSWFGKKFGFQKGHGYIGGGTPKGKRVSIHSEFKKGNKPWNTGTVGVVKAWNKGLGTKEPTRKYDHPKYRLWRTAVFERDDYTCLVCKTKGGNLQADHIKPWCEFAELRYVVSNGQTLCKKCHLEKTKKDLSVFWKNQFSLSKHRGTKTTIG